MTSNWFNILRHLIDVGAIPAAIHRVLLSGPPGTGKSYAASSLFGADKVLRIACHGERLPESFGYGTVALRKGDTVEIESITAVAMQRGYCLVIDEIDRLPVSCHSALLAALDDRESCRLFSETTSQYVSPDSQFVVVATTNDVPGNLDQALLDRFDLLLNCSAPASGLLDALQDRSRKFLTNLLPTAAHMPVYRQEYTPRALHRFERLAAVLNDENIAAELLFASEAANFLSSLKLCEKG